MKRNLKQLCRCLRYKRLKGWCIYPLTCFYQQLPWFRNCFSTHFVKPWRTTWHSSRITTPQLAIHVYLAADNSLIMVLQQEVKQELLLMQQRIKAVHRTWSCCNHSTTGKCEIRVNYHSKLMQQRITTIL